MRNSRADSGAVYERAKAKRIEGDQGQSPDTGQAMHADDR